MQRPISIIQFERFYLAAIGVDVVNTVLSWTEWEERALLHPQPLGEMTLPITTAIGFAVSLLLWFLIARRRSKIAKWLLTAFVLLALGWTVYAIPMGRYALGLSGLLGVFSTVLQAYAVWLMFRADARRWFTGAQENPA